MRRFWGTFPVVFIMMLSLMIVSLQAATTGKIAGVVKDAQSGEALAGVNVVIDGTMMGASTDINGRYFIINVPVGRYTVKATMMGYTSVNQENVGVSVDVTTEVNFNLSSTVLEGEVVTVEAVRPLVEKTLTQSKTTMSADEINNTLPIQDVHGLIETAASTFKGYVRGGRKYETKTLVDGVDVSDTYFSGGTGAFGKGDVGHGYQAFRRSEMNELTVGDVPNSAIQEMNIYAGTFTAEYPTASAGIINMVTKSGGKDYSGKLFIRATPLGEWEHFGSNPYYMKDSYIKNGDTLQVGYFDERNRLARSSSIKDQRASKLYVWDEDLAIDKYYYDPNDSVGLGRSYEIEGNLSGSIPGLGDKAGFFLTGRYHNIRTSAMPFDIDKRVVGSLKLHYDLNTDQRVTLYGQLNDGGKLFNFVNWKFNPKQLYYMEGAPRYKDLGLVGYIKWTHTLSPKTFYEVQISQSNKTSELGYPDDNGDGYCDIDETGDFIDFDSREEYLKYLGGVLKSDTTATGHVTQYIDWLTVDGYTGNWRADTLNDETVLDLRDPNRTFFYSEIDPNYMENKANFWGNGGYYRPAYPAALYGKTTRNVTTLKADLTSQVTFNHQIKTGVQYRMHYVDVNQLQSELGGAGHRYPMEAFHVDQHTFHPKEMAFYLQDRIEYGGMIINIGARVDAYDNDTQKFVNDFHPWDYHQDSTGTITELTPVRGDNVGFKWFFSPRLGVSHPVSDKMAMHYSFGQFVQYPNFASLYQDYNFTDYAASPSMVSIWPDQNPMRSTAYEIGLQWAPVSDIALDAIVYYRDVENYSNLQWTLTPYRGQAVRFQSSWGHADSRGIELTLEKRKGEWWSSRVTYAYSYIKAAQQRSSLDATQTLTFKSSTDSAKFSIGPADYTGLPIYQADYYAYRLDNIVVNSTDNPLAGGFDRTHRFTAMLMLFLPYDIQASGLAYLMSGFKYWPAENTENDPWFDISPELREGPWNYWINVRLGWEGEFGGIRLRPFAEVRNLTNKKNVLAYDRTGFFGSENQKIFELGRDGKPDTGDEEDPEGHWRRPFDQMGRMLYGPSRQIWVGMEIGF